MQGYINVHNTSLNSDEIMKTLSSSLIDSWWENYWVIGIDLMISRRILYMSVEFKYYFLSVSSLQVAHSKNH